MGSGPKSEPRSRERTSDPPATEATEATEAAEATDATEATEAAKATEATEATKVAFGAPVVHVANITLPASRSPP
eukprot:1762082-Prymnesium_polylepis.1